MATFRRWSVSKLQTVWAAGLLVVAVAVLLEVGAVQAQDQHAAPDYMPGVSPPPHEETTPNHHPLIAAHHTISHGGSGHPAPEHHLLKSIVVGHVLCRKCRERLPLPGSQVAVFCWTKDSEASFYGMTDGDGLYRIELEGFDYEKYGGNACWAKLVVVPPESPCRMAAGVTAMGPARLHVKSKAKDEVVLYSKTFNLLAASSVVECRDSESTQRPSTHGDYYPSPPYHGLSPVSHVYQNHPPPPLILHQTLPPHPHACTSPPPSESWPLSPPHLPYHASYIPPPLYHYYTPKQPPLYLPPHHENSMPPPPYHKQIMPLPPHGTDHLYSPPTSYYKPAYRPPYAHPETHPPPLYRSSPSTPTPPYEDESTPPPPYHEYAHTFPPPASAHILVPYPPAGHHETPAVGGKNTPHDLTPASIPRTYESPPPSHVLPSYSYHPPPVEYSNPHQSTQGPPLLNSKIPSFHKSTNNPPPAS